MSNDTDLAFNSIGGESMRCGFVVLDSAFPGNSTAAVLTSLDPPPLRVNHEITQAKNGGTAFAWGVGGPTRLGRDGEQSIPLQVCNL